MKKLFLYIFLGLLLSGNAYANCEKDLRYKVKWKDQDEGMVRVNIGNTSNKEIIIYKVFFQDENSNTIKSEVYLDGKKLPPFRHMDVFMKDKTIMWELWEITNVKCTYSNYVSSEELDIIK